MAKAKPKYPRNFQLRRVRITPQQALGTLAPVTVIRQSITVASANAYRCTSIVATWNLSFLTAGEGPITVGFAHSDYSVTEVKECLEANSAIDVGDKIAQERANRLVRVVGQFSGIQDENLNDGIPIKTKLNWKLGIGDTVTMFAYNESTVTLTTGALQNIAGDMWVKDQQ